MTTEITLPDKEEFKLITPALYVGLHPKEQGAMSFCQAGMTVNELPEKNPYKPNTGKCLSWQRGWKKAEKKVERLMPKNDA